MMAAAPAAVDPVWAESRSLAAAIEHWHRDRDPHAAMAALDAHDRRFPAGQMRTEARLMRAEILLSLGRDSESLALLDRLPLAELPRARELLTVRGELRVEHGRCAEGRADLEAVISRDRSDRQAERAAAALRHCP